MTTLRILCRGGEVLASERDRFRQLDGTLVAAADLTTANTIPSRGRVLAVRVVPPANGVLPCSRCGAIVADMEELREHGRTVHGRGLDGRRLLRVVG